MLKPSRKILRKEIKKDPLLETFERIESGFEKNRKTLVNIIFFFTLIIIGGLIFVNNQNETELESSSAFGAALVAYSNLDYDNAKFQFESISLNYEGTDSEILSNYYLGKIAYDLGDNNKAKLHLSYFLNNTENAALVCGAIKQLVDISFQENDFSNSFKILAEAKKFNINSVSELELKLLEIDAFLKINDLESAKIQIEKISENKDLPPHIKQEVDELIGVL